MSNKTLAPKLRFPEFLESGKWKSESLGDMYSFQSTNSFSRDQLNYERGSVKNIHYGDIHTKFSTLFDITKENVPFINPLESLNKIALESYCVEGDIVFADASEDTEDVGKSIELVYLNNEKLLAGMHTLLARQKEKRIVVGFGGYLFKSNRIRSQIKKEAQGAKVYGISANRLLNIDICFPADKKEQQKIADCLTSLDELIAAERAQLDALKDYKKGLLQNLFPAEGESLPALRFPEFQSAGEWEEKSLDDLDIYISDGNYGEKYPRAEEMKQSGVPFIRANNIKDSRLTWDDMKYIDADLHELLDSGHLEENDILVTTRGNIGMLAYVTREFHGANINAQICLLRCGKDLDSYYLLQYLSSDNCYKQFMALQTGSALKQLPKKNLGRIEIKLPSLPEQQKIAELLASIDEAIVAQGQRVAGLGVHKQGLLQGLFPVPEKT